MLKRTGASVFLRGLVMMMTMGRQAGRTGGTARAAGVALRVRNQKHCGGKQREYSNPDSFHVRIQLIIEDPLGMTSAAGLI
jgi:hypothetical protein